jgi:hypothetical protein
MLNDPFPVFQYLSLTQLGQVFDVSSHVIGRWLQEQGVRWAGVPTPEAVKHRLAKEVRDGDIHFWSWDKEQVVALLEEAGHERTPPGDSTPMPTDAMSLVGPFSMQPGAGNRFQVVGSDGGKAVEVIGRANADFMCGLMNLWHKYKPRQEAVKSDFC